TLPAFSFYCSRPHPTLHSFPTRRSSDLEHGLAEPHDDLHVVLDEQDGLAAVAELTDGLEEVVEEGPVHARGGLVEEDERRVPHQDRKSTRLNSSHVAISYAVFCLKKKKR